MAAWVAAAELWAYGPLAWRPGDLARATPADFARACAGWRWRDERAWEHTALVASMIAQAAGIKKRPADFLGRRFDQSRVPGYERGLP